MEVVAFGRAGAAEVDAGALKVGVVEAQVVANT